MLINALGHALKHVGLDLPPLLHVVFLLHALWLTGNWVEGSLLGREGWDAGLRIGGKATGNGNVLPCTAFRAEHTVRRNLCAAGIAVHGSPLPKGA